MGVSDLQIKLDIAKIMCFNGKTISEIINEGRVRIMEWAAVKRERREYEQKQREAKLRAEGKSEGRQELMAELKAKGIDVSKIESKPQK